MTHVINGGIIHSQSVPLKLRGTVGLYFIFSPLLRVKSPNLQTGSFVFSSDIDCGSIMSSLSYAKESKYFFTMRIVKCEED